MECFYLPFLILCSCKALWIALYTNSIHPFIFYTRLIRRSGRGGAGVYPSCHRARGGVHPGQVASPSQGHTETNETNNHTRSHSLLRTILESPINLTCMFLDGGRKPEYPERFYTNCAPQINLPCLAYIKHNPSISKKMSCCPHFPMFEYYNTLPQNFALALKLPLLTLR